MESHHATRKLIVNAVKCIDIGHLKNHQAFRRSSVLEDPVDEGMSNLCCA